jgi:hypothetical protein
MLSSLLKDLKTALNLFYSITNLKLQLGNQIILKTNIRLKFKKGVKFRELLDLVLLEKMGNLMKTTRLTTIKIE